MDQETNWEERYKAFVLEIENIGDDFGIYPAAVKGYNDERDYEQRDGFKNGWNAAVIEYGTKISEAGIRAAEGMNSDLSLLLAAGVGWLRDGVLWLNMNDTWAWACADAEEVKPENLPEVAGLFRRWGHAGLLYWVSEQNKQMKSEFKDNNRFIEFVRFEEQLRKQEPSSSKRAYMDVDNPRTPTPSMWSRLRQTIGV